jgi:DNA-binding transcriptional ArsR family regulator/uncharacterized protein YndB with AHSA1/START domain
MNEVFKALADPSRRQLLDRLNQREGQSLRELCDGLAMARQSVSKHLAVLEAANLVTTVRHGRETLHFLNAAPIQEISERWINHYDQPRVEALSNLKKALEEPAVEAPTFVYTNYIHTTPEKLWQALTEPAFTRQYWNTEFQSAWKAGSPMRWTCLIDENGEGVEIVDPAQVVLESEPYRHLSYTWHTFTPEFAERVKWNDELFAAVAAERRSRVTFDIEQDGDVCKLTVVHDDFDPGSRVVEMVSGGWPRVLSDLKSFVETRAPVAA